MAPSRISISPAMDYDYRDVDDMSQGCSMDGSRSEPTIPSADKEAYLTKCHWFGSIMFNAILAERLFRKSQATSKAELDFELKALLYDFPFAQCLQDLAAIDDFELAGDGTSSTSALVRAVETKIGVIINRGDVTARQQMIQLLQAGGTAESAFAQAPGVLRAPEVQQPSGVAVESESKQLAIYTMRLNEWCAKRNKMLSYSFDQLTVEPPSFKAVLALDGKKHTGIGKNKKMAQHMASKEACIDQEIKV